MSIKPFCTGGSYVNFQTADEGERARPGRLRRELRPPQRDQAPVRSGQPVPLEPQHPPGGRMTRIEAEHHFRVPLREAYDYITDLEHWPEYWPGLVRVEPGSQWREPGDQTRIVIRLLRHEVPLELTLRRVEPYRVVEYTSVQADLPPVHHERHWAEAGRRLRLPARGRVRAAARPARTVRARAAPVGDRTGAAPDDRESRRDARRPSGSLRASENQGGWGETPG